MITSAGSNPSTWAKTAPNGAPTTVARTQPLESTALTRSHSGSGTSSGNRLRRPLLLRGPVRDDTVDDGNEQPGRQVAGEGEGGHQEQRRRGHEVVEDDQPHPAVAVEQGAGDRADDHARGDAGEGDDARERR